MSAGQMKVLMIIDALHLGGAERVLATLSGAAPAAGFHFDVDVLSPPGRRQTVMEPVLAAAGVPISYLSISRLSDPRALPRLVRAIRRSDCDVVHAHLEYAATLAPLAARLAGRPALCTFHHVAVPLSRKEAAKERLAVAAANRSANVVFVSEASRASFARVYGGPRENWTVIENGVNLDVFTPEPASPPREFEIPAGAPVVTIVGALRWRKGHAVALSAWPYVRARVPNARLLIAGDGPEAAVLRGQARALDIEESVIFAGMRTDVADLIRASSLVLLPSQHEALPTTLIEAAACGRVVIATDVDGIPEVVADGETGLLVPFGDAEALGEAMIALLEDEPRRRAMGANARRLAEQRFDAKRWAARLYESYVQACDRRRDVVKGA
jgi:glycosyltransferase involved in cell wall biosynthesis